jgi:hypothetical protein
MRSSRNWVRHILNIMIKFPKTNTRKYSDSTRLTSSYDTSLSLINPRPDRVILSRKRGQVIKIMPPLLRRIKEVKHQEFKLGRQNRRKGKNFTKKKKLTAGSGLSAQYSSILCGRTVTPLRIFLRCSGTSSSVNSSAGTI